MGKNFEHGCDQVLSEWHLYLIATTIIITMTELALMQLFSIPVGSKQIKMTNKQIKIKIQNVMTPSFKSQLYSKQGSFIFVSFVSFGSSKKLSCCPTLFY